MEFLFLIFDACLRLRFLNVDTNLRQRRPVPDVFGILCSNVRGLAGNLSDLTLASSEYDILLCTETAGSRIRSTCLVVPGQDASSPEDDCICTRWLRSISPTQI